MSKMQILDCTLRDGGYINDFHFGKNAITKIINQLTIAGIDIIETGFLEDCDYDPDCSVYNSVEQIAEFIPSNRNKSMYVAMACYGEYSLDSLSVYNGKSIDGIRVTFHYNEIDEALEYCRQIQQKGYKLFVQPVGTSSYSDEQLLALIKRVNEMRPYSFYLVDTLGLMDQNEVMRFFYLINHNLGKGIHMGFHSHNNLQLSFSNCQALAATESDRTISLDSSVYGMGRGAGNLNTELIANYLNIHNKSDYLIEPILEIVDEYISKIKKEYEWGYSVPYYLAAINGCHPNYAAYLSSKNTLDVQSVSKILRMIEPDKRSLFSKSLAEEKYIEFQSHEVDDSNTLISLKEKLGGKNVLILAPGASLNNHIEKIHYTIKKQNCVVVSTSFVPDFINPDYVYISNSKRYNTTFNPRKQRVNLIHTSNMEVNEDNAFKVNYSTLLNPDDLIKDNSSLMLMNLLLRIGIKKVFIAGMDGFSYEKSNYCAPRLAMSQDRETIEQLNEAVKHRLQQLQSYLDIEFITPTLYQ